MSSELSSLPGLCWLCCNVVWFCFDLKACNLVMKTIEDTVWLLVSTLYFFYSSHPWANCGDGLMELEWIVSGSLLDSFSQQDVVLRYWSSHNLRLTRSIPHNDFKKAMYGAVWENNCTYFLLGHGSERYVEQILQSFSEELTDNASMQWGDNY